MVRRRKIASIEAQLDSLESAIRKLAGKRLDTKKVKRAAKEYADLTDMNDHTEALKVVAELLGNKKYVYMIYHIGEIQDLMGHMPDDLGKFRNSIEKELLATLRASTTTDGTPVEDYFFN